MSLPITGTGMITSLGLNKNTCFAQFCQGKTGCRPLQFFEPERFNLKVAYELSAQQESIKKHYRATQLLCTAISEAISSAKVDLRQGRLAVLIGTGLRELRSLELWCSNQQDLQVNELHFGSAVREVIGRDDLTIAFSNACSASNFALGLAEDMITLGDVDTVVVAGCDSLTESMFGLSDRVNPLRPECIQPFDRNRRGVLLGEGAAAIVLESKEQAKERGANCLAWLRGVGISCDAHHETAPDLEGILRSIQDAHGRAEITSNDVDLIMAHGTGTHLNDKVEALALQEVFGGQDEPPFITGLKSLTGHTSGASALVGVVTAIECMRQGRIPPTQGVHYLMQEAEGLNILVEEAETESLQFAQVNAFGFGGVNAVAILEKSIA